MDPKIATLSTDELISHAKAHPEEWVVYCPWWFNPLVHGEPEHVPSDTGPWMMDDESERRYWVQSLIEAGVRVKMRPVTKQFWWPFPKRD